MKPPFLENSDLIGGAKLRLGAAPMPWIGFVEERWGFRYVSPVLIDQAKYGASSDYGIHFVRSAKDAGLDYALSAVNGGGYAAPAATKSIDWVARVTYAVPAVEGLEISAGFRSGFNGKDTTAAAAANRASRIDALLFYKNNAFAAGAEYLSATNYTNTTGPVATKLYDVTTAGFSLFGNVGIEEAGGKVFVRYDSVKDDAQVD